MSTLERAIALAAEAHSGQLDKAGAAYITHPLRLMAKLSDPERQIVAVLHDVVEDTAVTFDDLHREGFAPEIITAIDALTKRAGETRLQAAERAAADPIARDVKLADVTDNMDLSRIAQPSEKDFARLAEYARVKALLEASGAVLAQQIAIGQAFVLMHGSPTPSVIGVFAIRTAAEAAIETLTRQPAFAAHPEHFTIEAWRIDSFRQKQSPV
jgi:soluble cytochrome b562